MLLYADNSDYGDHLKIVLSTPSSLKIDTIYTFSSESERNFAQYHVDDPSPPLQYNTRNGSGWVRFSRLDSVASGTFEFTAYYDMKSSSRTDPDTVRITEGRFDISRN